MTNWINKTYLRFTTIKVTVYSIAVEYKSHTCTLRFHSYRQCNNALAKVYKLLYLLKVPSLMERTASVHERLAADLRSQRKDATETQQLQLCFDKHFFSKLIKSPRNYDLQSESSTQHTSTQACACKSQIVDGKDFNHLPQHQADNNISCSKVISLPQRPSWLNDYHTVAISFPKYEVDLQNYLRGRTHNETTNNNGQRSLCVRTDRSWEYELQPSNLSHTLHTIIELLDGSTEDYKIEGNVCGWTVHIFMYPSSHV